MAADTEPGWQPEGRFEFSIGEPGQAFRQVRASLPFFPAQPDSVSDGGTAGALAVRAASVRGLHHRFDGKPRQDAYGAALSTDGQWLIAVVADGVGSGAKSQNAAGLVSRYGPELVRDQLAESAPSELDWWGVFEQLATIIVKHGQRSLETAATGRNAAGGTLSVLDVAREMASTATFVVCHTAPSVEDGWTVTVACQGDSPVWALSAGGCWRMLSGAQLPAADGLASSKVLGLPLLPAERGTHWVSTQTLTPDCAVFLMSDGVGNPLGDADDDVAGTLGRAWAHPPLQHQFTAQVGFGRKGFDDDRTVVGIWADGGGFANGGTSANGGRHRVTAGEAETGAGARPAEPGPAISADARQTEPPEPPEQVEQVEQVERTEPPEQTKRPEEVAADD